MKKIFIVFMFFSLFLLPLVGCKFDKDSLLDNFIPSTKEEETEEEQEEESGFVSVTFYLDEDEVYEEYFVERDSNINEPKNPEKEGYVFKGWIFYDETEEEWFPWNFKYYSCDTDTKIYAKWERIYNVTFVDENGNVLEEKEVFYGDKVALPVINFGSQYITNFYLDSTLITSDFTFSYEEDITIYCKKINIYNADIVKDLEFNEDGSFNPYYIEDVTLNLWSVVGDPDKTTLLNLISRFNTEYQGMIRINVTTIGHNEYYPALQNQYVNNFKNFPDMCLMHNEKNIEYAAKDYFRSVNKMIDLIGIDFGFDQVYDNIEGTTIMNEEHYGIPLDAHGYLMQIRQDIIKKNGLGFENNTRYVPRSYEEYNYLLNQLRKLADSGELWTRNITMGENHSWYQLKYGNPNLVSPVTSSTFYPGFLYEEESDLLTALYVNGGTLVDSNGKVNFQNCTGFVKYITDFVNRKNTNLYGDALGGKEIAFSNGRIVFFSEGPWQTASRYDYLWNNNELITVGNGVTAEDANDPVYSKPYTISRSYWSAQPDATGENASKWYGNGHVLTLNKKMTSAKKIAAALVFTKWLTQGKNAYGEYNLVDWCSAGHLPAWKNVYASNEYKIAVSKSLTLQALDDPANIITLESTPYASTLISGVTDSFKLVLTNLLSEDGCTVDEAVIKVNNMASSVQQILEILKLQNE